jgi:hypothetical protein
VAAWIVSGAFEGDGFDDVGDVLALVHGGFDDFEDFLPLDDLDGVFFFVEELCDEGTAEAVALVFEAVDLNSMPEDVVRCSEGVNGGGNLGGCLEKNLCEVADAVTDFVHAVEDEAAGSGVGEVQHIVELGAELVDVLAVKGRDEGLVELQEDVVSDFVALVLDGLDVLRLFRHAGVVREHFHERSCAGLDVFRLHGEEIEKTLIARQQSPQKAWHRIAPPEELR